ncbi:hypothetical protein [Streptomyces griseosporeus]|jgi:hypothetical protein|uniref:hypothetical protein n=1 Tax=Streptomyces griseosporeus TaxID=1910 RepID=UPI00369AE118
MKFVLEVALDEGALKDDPVAELGRILRYWAGNVRHYPLKPGDRSDIYDSGYRDVGEWRVVASGEGAP